MTGISIVSIIVGCGRDDNDFLLFYGIPTIIIPFPALFLFNIFVSFYRIIRFYLGNRGLFDTDVIKYINHIETTGEELRGFDGKNQILTFWAGRWMDLLQ